ncbi:Mg2+ and Co2+ transporter CorA [Gracilibacillus ureilyticus]|uniref:Mg2+ and Co2+ transporter CorA n=1 Tax=Gracilibacillus ureilyticus TaxID=531814 RepID=A0A1H9M6Z6_9BACI|nr:magnesium transporter CorA family protein [Gracilibacillus ureilyticus]SER19209.1 Mg2+ and Co2+ transporter CorA [Gracilibacillus ureilyticus]
MISIFLTTSDGTVKEEENFIQNSWIRLTEPTLEEINTISENCRVPVEFLENPLDAEETTRIEHDKETECTLIINDFPVPGENSRDVTSYITIPIGIIITPSFVITVCSKDVPFLNQLKGPVNTRMKSRLALQILYSISALYLDSLNELNKQRIAIEEKLKQALTNKQLYDLMEIEKSLVYFMTSLRANDDVLKKILRTHSIKMYEEDKDLLNEMQIENTQGMETTELYSRILDRITSSYSSLISNDMNNVMKTLTLFTIFLTLPTLVFSFFGMNVDLPFKAEGPFAWLLTIIISIILCVIVAVFLWRNRIFKK